MRWTPRTPFWKRSSEAAQPDLRIDIPGWRTLFVDVAIVYPQVGSPGVTVATTESKKKLAYKTWVSLSRIRPVDFSPLVFEAFGRIGNQSKRLIGKLANRSASDRGVSGVGEHRRWLAMLGTRLQKEQADILLNS